MESMKYIHSIYSLFLFLCFADIFVLSWDCPPQCSCNATDVECVDRGFQTKDLVLFEKIPDTVVRVTVTGNNFTDLPQFMFGNCADATFQELSLKYLDLSSNRIANVHEKTFHCLPNLKTLILKDNAWLVVTNSSGFFSTLSLTHLDMGAAFEQLSEVVNYTYHVTNLETVFNNSKLNDLEYLNIASNNIWILPNTTTDMMCNFSNLKELIMSNNSLGSLYIQRCLRNLEVLDITSNSIPLIKESEREILESFSHLKTLLMANNPYECDCHMVDFRSWLNDTRVVITDKKQLQCVNNNRTVMSMSSDDLVCEDPDKNLVRTSYIVLGCVFAIIGVIFVIVMFLNRATIKRKVKNYVEPCCQFATHPSHQSYATVNV